MPVQDTCECLCHLNQCLPTWCCRGGCRFRLFMPSFDEGWNLRWLLIILMDSTFLEKKHKSFIKLAWKQQQQQKKQTIKQEILSLPSLYCFSRTLIVSPEDVRSYTPPKCLVSSIFMGFMYSPLINLISTKSQMIILRPYSDDFTHNSLCPQKVLGAGKSVSMPLFQDFVDFPHHWRLHFK